MRIRCGLSDLVKDGKIYLSLSDAIALALENNYDIAIARYDLDIADLDILRTRAGAARRWASQGQVNSNTLGGYVFDHRAPGGGPGGTTGGSGGAGSGAAGLTLTASGAGPAPESYMDPRHRQRIQFDAPATPSPALFSGGSPHHQYLQLHLQPGLCHRHGLPVHL